MEYGGYIYMEKKNGKDATKKLRNLVKNRKTPVVITKQGSIRNNKRHSDTSCESYCYSSYNNN